MADTNIDARSVKFTAEGSVKSGAGMEPIKRVSLIISHADLTDADTAQAITVGTIPHKATLLGIGRKLLEDFAGGGNTAVVLDVGDGSNVDRFIDNVDVFTGAANTFILEDPAAFGDATAELFPLPLGAAGGFDLVATFTSTTGTVAGLTAGRVRITAWYFLPEDEDLT